MRLFLIIFEVTLFYGLCIYIKILYIETIIQIINIYMSRLFLIRYFIKLKYIDKYNLEKIII
jgi:hypothetical protein